MLKVFYSPHATSVDNEEKRASGHADVPLSPAGRQLAQELGQHYATETLDAICYSDLQRAATTAQLAFAERGIPLVPDARLREYDYGDFTQYPIAQVETEFPRRVTEPFPHGESLLMVTQRIGAFLHDALQAYDGKTVGVIGHRATKYGLEYWCGGYSLEEIVNTPWEWRDIPIWCYEIDKNNLAKELVIGNDVL